MVSVTPHGDNVSDLTADTAGVLLVRLRDSVRTCACLALVAWLIPLTATAQSVRDAIAGAGLGSGYAQMLNLASTPDLSSAQYKVSDDDPDTTIGLTRIPYESKWVALTPTTDLYWRIAGSHFQMKDTLTVQVFEVGGTVDSRWTAWSATAGVYTSTELGSGFRIQPAVDFGFARLDNSGSYRGPAVDLKPVLDGLLFNWNMYAWLVTPSLAMEWADVTPERRMRIRTHAAYSWIQSFDESNRVLGFRENAGTYSVRGEYAAPTGLRIMDRSLDWVGFASYGGFFGGNRGALGFTTVSEVGAGLESPFDKGNPLGQQVRVSASYLFGPSIRGWTVGIGLEF